MNTSTTCNDEKNCPRAAGPQSSICKMLVQKDRTEDCANASASNTKQSQDIHSVFPMGTVYQLIIAAFGAGAFIGWAFATIYSLWWLGGLLSFASLALTLR